MGFRVRWDLGATTCLARLRAQRSPCGRARQHQHRSSTGQALARIPRLRSRMHQAPRSRSQLGARCPLQLTARRRARAHTPAPGVQPPTLPARLHGPEGHPLGRVLGLPMSMSTRRTFVTHSTPGDIVFKHGQPQLCTSNIHMIALRFGRTQAQRASVMFFTHHTSLSSSCLCRFASQPREVTRL